MTHLQPSALRQWHRFLFFAIVNESKETVLSNAETMNMHNRIQRCGKSCRIAVVCLVFLLGAKTSLAFTPITQTTSPIVTRRRQQHTQLYASSTPKVFDADRVEAEKAKQRAMEKRRQRSLHTNGASEKDDPEWKFFDTARIHVTGGDGGNGCVAFRREKGEPLGGPSGGRGGQGGSIYLVCDEGLNTLAPLRNRVHVRAEKGRNGLGKNKDGAKGRHIMVSVPPGTVVRDLKTQKLAGELRKDGERLLVARGGRGGRGNAAFMTQRRTAPKLAEHGEPGAKRWLSVELRLVADVGFLGKPNAGKSTLLAAASAARPKIANYPFTTIVPNLGVCDLGDEGAGLVLCDIPGLIEGASGGAGLGPAFLRHVQRCKVLLHVVDGTSEDPIGDFKTINKELELYDEFLAKKPQVVVLNKIDVPEVQERQEELLEQLREAAGHSRVLSISAATTERVKELMGRLKKFVSVQPAADLPPPAEIDFSKAALDFDSDDYGELLLLLLL
jgi:GTP-binding protein